MGLPAGGFFGWGAGFCGALERRALSRPEKFCSLLYAARMYRDTTVTMVRSRSEYDSVVRSMVCTLTEIERRARK